MRLWSFREPHHGRVLDVPQRPDDDWLDESAKRSMHLKSSDSESDGARSFILNVSIEPQPRFATKLTYRGTLTRSTVYDSMHHRSLPGLSTC